VYDHSLSLAVCLFQAITLLSFFISSFIIPFTNSAQLYCPMAWIAKEICENWIYWPFNLNIHFVSIVYCWLMIWYAHNQPNPKQPREELISLFLPFWFINLLFLHICIIMIDTGIFCVLSPTHTVHNFHIHIMVSFSIYNFISNQLVVLDDFWRAGRRWNRVKFFC
jgi:hypothetical protein